MNDFERRFQRYLVYILRHHPSEIGLVLGKDGFVSISELLQALKKSHTYHRATEKMIYEAVANQTDKQRLEIDGHLIRARYGHSQGVIEELEYPPVEPPDFLYHGTAESNKESILEKGLLPRSRKYVHLSENHEIAMRVASRHSQDIIIFTVLTKEARLEGIEFYHPEELIWLTKNLPAQFLRIG